MYINKRNIVGLIVVLISTLMVVSAIDNIPDHQ